MARLFNISPWLSYLGLAVLLLVVTTSAGLIVIAFSSRHLRVRLLPAAPVLGVGIVIVLLQWLNLVVSVSTAAPVVVGLIFVGLLAVGFTRQGSLRFPVRSVVALGLCVASAVPAVVISLAPSSHMDQPGIGLTSTNNDAVYYTSLGDWVKGHTVFDEPQLSANARSEDSPQDGPTAQAFSAAQRWGEPELQAFLSTLARAPIGRFWGPLSALWLLLLPGGVYLLALAITRSFRASVIGAVFAGLVVAAGGMVVFGVLNQNSPLTLGLGLSVALGGALLMVARRRGGLWTGLAAVMGGAFVNAYFEYSLVLALLVLPAALLWPGRARLLRFRDLVIAGVVIALVVPVAVYRAVSGLLLYSSLGGFWPDYFTGIGLEQSVSRLIGTNNFGDPPLQMTAFRSALTWMLVVLWVAVAGVALTRKRVRVPLIGVPVMGAAIWWLQSRGSNDYAANRLVTMVVPITLMVAAIGCSQVMASRRAPNGVRVGSRVIGCALVPVVLLGTSSMVSDHIDLLATRAPAFANGHVNQVIGWVREHGGPDGSGVAIMTTRFRESLILQDALRGLEDIPWPSLYPDYTALTTFGADEYPGYVVTEPGAVDNGDAPVEAANDAWALRKVGSGGVVLGRPLWNATDPEEPQPALNTVGTDRQRWTGGTGTAGIVSGPECADGLPLKVRSANGSAQNLELTTGWGTGAATPVPVVAVTTDTAVVIPSPPDGVGVLTIAGEGTTDFEVAVAPCG